LLNTPQQSFGQLRLSPQRFANWLAGDGERTDGLRTLDLRLPRASKVNVGKVLSDKGPRAARLEKVPNQLG